MKHTLKIGFIALLVSSISFVSCNNEGSDAAGDGSDSTTVTAPVTDPETGEPVSNLPVTAISYPETEFDFGTIQKGEKVQHSFKFTNTGSNPLVISNARGSCGCTVPTYSKEPIAPGATGEILVEFDSNRGGNGNVSKTVTVTANTEPTTSTLKISANVEGGAEPQGIPVDKIQTKDATPIKVH